MEILTIIIVNFILYFKTIFFNIIIDDIRMRAEHEKKNTYNKWNFKCIVDRLYGAGTFKDLRVDHGFTIVLHTLAAILIYLSFGSNIVSFYAALLYSVHPVNNQTAIWLNGRRYIVNVILVLLIWMFKPIGIVAYAVTPLFQIGAISAPLLYLFTDYWYVSVVLMLFPLLCNKYIISKFKSRNNKRILRRVRR